MSGIPSWARVGAKVVCVDDSRTRVGGDRELSVGTVYVLRWVGSFDSSYEGAFQGACVQGITRLWGGQDYPFSLDRFRPLITQEDDIKTHFRALLGAPQSVEA